MQRESTRRGLARRSRALAFFALGFASLDWDGLNLLRERATSRWRTRGCTCMRPSSPCRGRPCGGCTGAATATTNRRQ